MGEKFQQRGQEVGQFVVAQFEAVFAVFFQQIHHGAAAVAVFAENVLENIQRMQAVAVEGGNVFLLDMAQAVAAQIIQQRLQTLAVCG